MKCPRCNNESLSFEDSKNNPLDNPYCFECGDSIKDFDKDQAINPDHYKDSEIECIDAIESMLSREEFTGFLRASHFQYMWRYKNKNGVEDLKKADWYLNKLIHHETNNRRENDI